MTGRVLVTGATGSQGGAAARALHRTGAEVLALVRDPDSPPARALAVEGIALVVGDLDDPIALDAACSGCTAVFSVQAAGKSEQRHGRNLVDAAHKAGVAHMVHTSVSATGWRAAHPEVTLGVELSRYWDNKESVEAMVRDAGFPVYTILKPAFMMDNFMAPKAAWLFPFLAHGELPVAVAPETAVALVSAADIGAAVVAAITDPRRFARVELELGGDLLTFPEIAETITRVTGRPVSASCVSAAEVDAKLGAASWSSTHVWLNSVGYAARPEHAAAYGLELSTFERWATAHADEVRAATARPRD
ncbi:NmrA/HSCARG family protein [Nocardia sp. BSTN01]|uniref:NmrA/HSCARG family protein n=1 Tax=Nocardia sp. BSTN01 TaxID=2783665 RepID=UPI00188E09E1|nr:NmrA/HSCARG family protein [Nocardia sp. BSTN01]MBF4997364.1 NmrA/HSCARG family protein [Nocardia sp. BSTN01]